MIYLLIHESREYNLLTKTNEVFIYVSHSVMSDYLRPHGLWPTKRLCLWNFPGKKRGVGSRSVSPGDLTDAGTETGSPVQADSLPLSHQGEKIIKLDTLF